MDQNQTDRHLTKNFYSQCRVHPAQTPKYYCSDSNCRTSLCLTCIKTHPKEHAANITAIKDVKSQTFDILKKETMKRFDTLLDSLFKSDKMNHLFKETFGNLMQQNSTVDLDDEDIADILADTLQRKYFEKGVAIAEKIQEEASINFSDKCLIAFDYSYHSCDDDHGDHEENAQKFCQSSSDYYCRDELGSFYAKSKGQIIFWNNEDQTLLCKDIATFDSEKYNISTYFQFLTVLESEEGVLFVVDSGETLIAYSEDNSSLKLRQEFPLEEEDEIVFLSSDHVNHLFVVTTREDNLRANLYALKNRNGALELLKLSSFQPFDQPKKTAFDQINNLLFILGDSFLEVYRYRTASLQKIFKVKTTDFEWHQTTQRLLLINSGKVYQFNKGKFRLIKSIDKSNSLVAFTNQGVFCLANGLFLDSIKNPGQRKDLILPSVKSEMKRYQDEALSWFDSRYDEPEYGDLKTNYETAKVVAETPDHLFIFVKVTSSQDASLRLEYDKWRSFKGKIYCQYLLRYDLSQKKFQVLE